MSRFLRIDDLLSSALENGKDLDLPGQAHKDKTNTVVFSSRPANAELSDESAFADLKNVMEFVLNADGAFAEAVGLDPSPIDPAS